MASMEGAEGHRRRFPPLQYTFNNSIISVFILYAISNDMVNDIIYSYISNNSITNSYP